MPNPLFAALGGTHPQLPPQMSGPMQMIQQFFQFKNSFQGSAKQEVQKLLNSGQMSQGQLNQLQGMAQQFMQMMQMTGH